MFETIKCSDGTTIELRKDRVNKTLLLSASNCMSSSGPHEMNLTESEVRALTIKFHAFLGEYPLAALKQSLHENISLQNKIDKLTQNEMYTLDQLCSLSLREVADRLNFQAAMIKELQHEQEVQNAVNCLVKHGENNE